MTSEEEETNNSRNIALTVVGVVVVLAMLIVIVRLNVFGPYDETTGDARATTLWDWLELLIVPVTLVLAVHWLDARQKKEEQAREDRQRQEERAREDRENASTEDNRLQANLEAYYNRMMDLMLKKSPLEPGNKDALDIARAMTRATFTDLDGYRKGQLFGFLLESGFLDPERGLDFLHARTDLSQMQLNKFYISGKDLGGADMRRVHFSEVSLAFSSLPDTILSNANLQQVSFEGCDLAGADFSNSILRYANLTDTNLNEARLPYSDLSNARLLGAMLTNADLSGATLKEAQLNGEYYAKGDEKEKIYHVVNLEGAKMIGVDLSGAKLKSAKLDHADLTGSRNWTIEQLKKASYASFGHTTMPDGIVLQHINLDREVIHEGPTFDEWAQQYMEEHGGTPQDLRNASDDNE